MESVSFSAQNKSSVKHKLKLTLLYVALGVNVFLVAISMATLIFSSEENIVASLTMHVGFITVNVWNTILFFGRWKRSRWAAISTTCSVYLFAGLIAVFAEDNGIAIAGAVALTAGAINVLALTIGLSDTTPVRANEN